jgi:hypothetical protein
MDQEEDGVGYIEEDHPLRPQAAAQSLALLQVPEKSGRSRNISISSSVTDLSSPIYAREDARSSRRNVSAHNYFSTIMFEREKCVLCLCKYKMYRMC